MAKRIFFIFSLLICSKIICFCVVLNLPFCCKMLKLSDCLLVLAARAKPLEIRAAQDECSLSISTRSAVHICSVWPATWPISRLCVRRTATSALQTWLAKPNADMSTLHVRTDLFTCIYLWSTLNGSVYRLLSVNKPCIFITIRHRAEQDNTLQLLLACNIGWQHRWLPFFSGGVARPDLGNWWWIDHAEALWPVACAFEPAFETLEEMLAAPGTDTGGRSHSGRRNWRVFFQTTKVFRSCE